MCNDGHNLNARFASQPNEYYSALIGTSGEDGV